MISRRAAHHTVFATAALCPGPQTIAAFVQARYGLTVEVEKLTSERDDNYRLLLTDGSVRLLKLAHSAEAPAVVDFETRAFVHLASRAPAIPVQRLVPALDGAVVIPLAAPKGDTRWCRMFTYVPGVPQSGCPTSARQAAALGLLAADLDIALRDFTHPAAARELLWDIQHAAQTRGLLRHTPAPDERALCEDVLTRFERHTQPVLRELRSQVIHNDLNPHNVIVDPLDADRVAGIIDFGDMVHAPLIDEIAVASAYLVGVSDAPLGTVPQFVAAYHSRLPLAAREIAILPQLIAVRQAITVLITHWRAGLHPGNRDYIMRNQRSALLGLGKLMALGEERAARLLLDACGDGVR